MGIIRQVITTLLMASTIHCTRQIFYNIDIGMRKGDSIKLKVVILENNNCVHLTSNLMDDSHPSKLAGAVQLRVLRSYEFSLREAECARRSGRTFPYVYPGIPQCDAQFCLKLIACIDLREQSQPEISQLNK
jgi:hypothetical protein